jgi:predicted RNase H-like HicB family nuclease
MNYPVVIHKDQDSDYGVTVPDLPGCFSAGKTVDEALAMAKEAIELHLEGLIEDGNPVPRPGRIEQLRQHPDYRDGTWALVSIAPESLRVHAKRINITMPERILEAIDRFSQQRGQTRSGVLAEAAVAYMRSSAEQSCPSGRDAKRFPTTVKTRKRRRGA